VQLHGATTEDAVPPDDRTIGPVATAITAFIGRARRGPFNRPVRVGSGAEYVRVFGALVRDDTLGLAVQQYFANGAGEALVVRVRSEADISDPALESRREGLWALEGADLFTLLCVPPPAFDGAADISVQTRRAAVRYCVARRAIFLADPLVAWQSPSDVGSVSVGLESAAWGLGPTPNAAAYFPRLRVAGPNAGGDIICVPCGAVAGVIARTDAAQGVWKAPAGQRAALQGVKTLATTTLSEGEHDTLGAYGVNGLRFLPTHGPVVWGARTLEGTDAAASEWKYLPVRRLALHLEESIERGTRWAADEPNDEPLWAQVRQHVGTFLHELFRRGAFQGHAPRDAFFVRCDRSTMTPLEIAEGRLVVVVGFAPLKPAEFVVVTVRQPARRQGG
jgi:hypothetical protein